MTKFVIKWALLAPVSLVMAVIARIEQKIENEKALLDKETRRQVRKFWIFVSALCFGLGAVVGNIF